MKNIIVDIASLGQIALSQALTDRDFNILGVTVSPDVDNYDDLANFNLEAVRAVSAVPVYKGAQRPLLDKRYVSGKKCVKIGTEHSFEEKHRVNFILDSVKEYPDLEIICLGTLSNIALAVLKDEAAMKKVKRIYVAGGALLGYKTTTPTSHHNILADAEAADTVFKSGIPITLIPANSVKDLPEAAFKVAKGAACDTWQAYVTIDTSIGMSRGQTVIDLVGRNPINGDVTPGVKQTVVTALKEDK